MMGLRSLRRIGKDRRGSSAVEFALLAPVFIACTMGILQIGLSVWRYNALRGISADVARYAVTHYQAKTDPAAGDIQTWARTMASAPPYSLPASDLTLTVTPVATSRIAGTIEMNITVQSQIPSLVPFIDFSGFQMSYSRPAFLVDNP